MRYAVPLCVALLALPFHGVAAEECTPTTSDPEIDTGDTPVGRYYYDCTMVLAVIPCVEAAMSYRESNGIDGLQRDDYIRDDTCGGMIPADTLLTKT